MRPVKNLKSISILVGMFFLLFVCCNFTNAQQLNKTFQDIGGGNTNNTSVDNANDNTMLYVVGGAVVVGIVVYALLQKDKKENVKKDSSTTSSSINNNILVKDLTFEEKISAAKSAIPINILFGFQPNKTLIEERRYFVGLSYNF